MTARRRLETLSGKGVRKQYEQITLHQTFASNSEKMPTTDLCNIRLSIGPYKPVMGNLRPSGSISVAFEANFFIYILGT